MYVASVQPMAAMIGGVLSPKTGVIIYASSIHYLFLDIHYVFIIYSLAVHRLIIVVVMFTFSSDFHTAAVSSWTLGGG